MRQRGTTRTLAVLLPLLVMTWLAPMAGAQEGSIYNEQLALTGDWLSDHQVRLSWDRPRYPVRLERKVEGDPFFRSIATFDRDNEYIDEGLTVNTTYQYRLRPDPTWYLDEYGPPIDLRFEIGQPNSPRVERVGIDRIRISAPEDTLDWPGELMVELRVEGVFEEVGRLNETDTSLVIPDLETWRIQLVRTAYVTEHNESEPSVPDTTYMPFPAPKPPRANILSDHSIELYWESPTRWTDHAYQIQKLEGTDTTMYSVGTGDTSWVDEAVNFNRRTFYRVRGVSGDNIGEFSNMVSARLQMNTVEGLQVDEIEDLTVELTWTEPAPVSTNYFIQRSINEGDFVTIAELPSTARRYVDTLPERGLDVSYRVVSTNSMGDRIVSDAVSQQVRDVAWGMVLLQNGPGGQAWYVDADEVSAGEFTRFCEDTGRDLPEPPDHVTTGFWYEANALPAVMVTWDDAIEFCNWRSRSLGLEEAYDDSGRVVNEAGGFRLPDSALYHQALRDLAGGLEGARANANLLGNEDGYRWFAPGLGQVINPQSMIHMIGNVAEWMQDPIRGDGRMALGGAFSTPADIVRRVPMTGHPLGWYSSSIGFRCVLPATEVASGE